jgi:hypothetical protein
MGKDSDELIAINRKLDGIISIHNALENIVEKLGFDLRFIRAWTKEQQIECESRRKACNIAPRIIADK